MRTLGSDQLLWLPDLVGMATGVRRRGAEAAPSHTAPKGDPRVHELTEGGPQKET